MKVLKNHRHRQEGKTTAKTDTQKVQKIKKNKKINMQINNATNRSCSPLHLASFFFSPSNLLLLCLVSLMAYFSYNFSSALFCYTTSCFSPLFLCRSFFFLFLSLPRLFLIAASLQSFSFSL